MPKKSGSDAMHDTIVIGAGPAGSEIAYRLAKVGFDVLVLEKDQLDREKPCGGGIQLKELLEFGRLPRNVIERKIRKVRIVSPENKILEAGMKGLFTATVKRSVYDKYLQQRAKDAGARFLRKKAVSIRKAKNVSVKAGNTNYKARLVVDARGYSGQKTHEKCMTYHVWLKGKDIGRKFGNSIELYFLKEIPQGYAWIFPKKDIVSVGIGSIKKVNLRKILENFIRKHPIASKKLKGYRTIKKGGGIVPLGINPKLYSDSGVVVGDAGGFANIIHGGGIYQARKSAKIAAKHCIKFLKTNDKDNQSRQKHLEDYDREARDFFENYETKWDRKIRNILWNQNTLEKLVEKGRKDKEIQKALGIVLTSARSHEKAYQIMEKKLLEIIYTEMDAKTGEYKKEINSGLSKIFPKQDALHGYANEILLNDKAKRLRAYLGILAAEMFGAKTDIAVNFSLVYELFHTASLVHDDIMDNADKRRGKKTLHVKYSLADAIITGDLMLAKGYSLISQFSGTTAISKKQVLALLDIIGETGEKCCIGQSKDISMSEKRHYYDIKDYLDMAELKTGSLIEGSVKGGAVVGCAGRKDIDIIGRFGLNLGIAFQIIDDSLDLIGGAKANKSVMNDLKQAKATPMLIHTLHHADRKEKKRIMKAVGNPRLTKNMADNIVELYRKYDAIGFAQRLSREYVDNARKELRNLPKSEARNQLSEILDVMGYWSLLGE
ncbi:geranylgeranyl reductase family protein [Thermoproteota archaeon]